MAWASSSLIMMPLALLAVFVAIPPMIIQLRAKNFPASILIIGITILNVQNLLNAVIWHSNNDDGWWDGKILCDIEVKLYLGIFQATDGAIASIFRQIAIILHPDHIGVSASPRQQKIRWIFELTLCVFLPVYVMVGHYFTQRRRYWIRPTTGCITTFDTNYAAPFLTYLWPLVGALIGSTYCLISTIRLCKHRKQMSSVLSRPSGATASRYSRLFAFAFTLLAVYCPISIFVFIQNVMIPMHKYSWSYIHPPNWSERIVFEQNGGHNNQQISFDRWAQLATAYIIFLFFGLGQEAVQMYSSWIGQVKCWFRVGPRRIPVF
jgi:pheromone a factor receptor